MKKKTNVFFILVICVFMTHNIYAQGRPKTVITNLSPEPTLVVTLQEPPKLAVYNLSIMTRIDYGFLFHGAGVGKNIPFLSDAFFLTALEFYIPVYHENTRILLQARFTGPLVNFYNTICASLYRPRLGLGFGGSTILTDKTDRNGRGSMVLMNYLAAVDFRFIPTYLLDEANFKEESVLFRIEWGFRWNIFVRRNFAFVIGLDTSTGFAFQEYFLRLEDDRFPTSPNTNFGRAVRPFATIGLVFGLMI